MKTGIISKLCCDKGYGFLIDEVGNSYFFHCSDLLNCKIEELEINEQINFDAKNNKERDIAVNIQRTIQKKSYSGINPKMKRDHFSSDENKIIDVLGETFYVTNGGYEIRLGIKSVYRFCLVKPTSDFEIQFNLNRELVVVFSDYADFEPRTLDAISEIHRKNTQNLRIDRICSVIISRDNRIEYRVKDILKNDMEMQMIVPFSYDELSLGDCRDKIINRFRNNFFERDLFAFSAPLQKDIYFFGRRDYVQALITRHFSGENSGVFGLRRSGKTSILNAVMRSLNRINRRSIWLDCQELHFLRWNKAIYRIIEKISEEFNFRFNHSECDYDENNTASIFAKDLNYFFAETKEKSLLLLFDEIEQISFKLSLSDNWKNKNDFTLFWQVIRMYFQSHQEQFNFIIAGTNPTGIETIYINEHENPLYNQIKTDNYIIPFDVPQTKEMVDKLGGYMGLDFDYTVCAKLKQDFGGHPFLIRHYCSAINKYVNDKHLQKPISITKTIYDKVMPIFIEKYADNYCKLIVEVLARYYPEENAFIEKLAIGDEKWLEIHENRSELISHLIGYGIVEKNQGLLGFKIDILKKYLKNKLSYQKLCMTNEEKQAEISERRNKLEPKLRAIVRNQLRAQFGEAAAKQKVFGSIDQRKQNKYIRLKYDELFDPNSCEIYLYQLLMLISQNWSCFQNIFSLNKPTFTSYMTLINNLRKDCHAAEVEDSEMQSFRGAITALEKEVNIYFGTSYN